MMKLLYIPTGNVFTLPDNEAIKIKNQDKFNYKILDAGYIEPVEEVLTPATVQELVMGSEEETEADDVVVEEAELPKNTDEDLLKMSREELYNLAKRLELKGASKKSNKAQLIELINKKGE